MILIQGLCRNFRPLGLATRLLVVLLRRCRPSAGLGCCVRRHPSDIDIPVPRYYRLKMAGFGVNPGIGSDFWLGTASSDLGAEGGWMV